MKLIDEKPHRPLRRRWYAALARDLGGLTHWTMSPASRCLLLCMRGARPRRRSWRLRSRRMARVLRSSRTAGMVRDHPALKHRAGQLAPSWRSMLERLGLVHADVRRGRRPTDTGRGAVCRLSADR